MLLLIAALYRAHAPAPAQEATNSKVPATIDVTYQCDNGLKAYVHYDNSDPTHTTATFRSDRITTGVLVQGISGSGVRYLDNKYLWWSKGNTGFLTESAGTEKMLINNCIAIDTDQDNDQQ